MKDRYSVKPLALIVALFVLTIASSPAAEPRKETKKRNVDLGRGVGLELVRIPAGEFMAGSTSKERAWATGPEGGAGNGDRRENFEGDPRPFRIRDVWMGRTEVTVAQWRRFVEESGYVTDAEKPGGKTHCFDPEWKAGSKDPLHPWKSMPDKSWRDPNFPFAMRDDHPVVCVSWNDCMAFCRWLTERERKAGRLPKGLVYRLPTDAEWEYACRGGRESSIFWWGDSLKDGEGRLNINGADLLPGRNHGWARTEAPWSDGFPLLSPVDHFGERGRNGYGLADTLGNVWEICLDHWDPKGAHETVCLDDTPRRVCRGVSFLAIPGYSRCAVRLGLRGAHYSDSRDGFRLCLGSEPQAFQILKRTTEPDLPAGLCDSTGRSNAGKEKGRPDKGRIRLMSRPRNLARSSFRFTLVYREGATSSPEPRARKGFARGGQDVIHGS